MDDLAAQCGGAAGPPPSVCWLWRQCLGFRTLALDWLLCLAQPCLMAWGSSGASLRTLPRLGDLAEAPGCWQLPGERSSGWETCFSSLFKSAFQVKDL